MKAKRLFLTMICASLLSVEAHAQFNTIGSAYHKPIKTVNPPKQAIALTDSIVSTDSLHETAVSEMIGKEIIPDSAERTERNALVALPLKSIHIGSGYGMRVHPIYHKKMLHNGIDLTARYENVFSMFPGTVIQIGQDSRSGKYVTVRTGNYTISYCHLSVPYVHINDYVDAGTPIACSGNTGASTGPHLHITAKKDGKAFNPTTLLEYILHSF